MPALPDLTLPLRISPQQAEPNLPNHTGT